MPHLVSSDVTAVPAIVRSDGGAVVRVTDFYTISQAVSASISVAMMALPPGAQVLGGKLLVNGSVPKGGSAAYGLSVYNSLSSDVYVATASAATEINFSFTNQVHAGRRHTASSNIIVVFQPSGFGAVSGDVSAVASCGCKLVVEYLTNQTGD